jgi:hypothetical protein
MYDLHTENKYHVDEQTDLTVVKPGKDKVLYYFEKGKYTPHKAIKYSAVRKHTFVNYSDYMNEIPGGINLYHKNIKFTLSLSFLK